MAVAKLKHTPKTYAQADMVLREANKSQVALAGNTFLTRTASGIEVSYYGSPIVRYSKENGTSVSWAGYPTYTTTGRIHQLIYGQANIIKGEPALDDVVVDSTAWHKVNNF